jgi:hypothetical protein
MDKSPLNSKNYPIMSGGKNGIISKATNFVANKAEKYAPGSGDKIREISGQLKTVYKDPEFRKAVFSGDTAKLNQIAQTTMNHPIVQGALNHPVLQNALNHPGVQQAIGQISQQPEIQQALSNDSIKGAVSQISKHPVVGNLLKGVSGYTLPTAAKEAAMITGAMTPSASASSNSLSSKVIPTSKAASNSTETIKPQQSATATAPAAADAAASPAPAADKDGGEVPLTPEQKEADVRKLTAVFIIIATFIQNILNEFKQSSTGTSVFTVLALLLTLSTMFLSIMYLVQLLTDYSNGKLISNPLNLEAPDYIISKSVQFFGSKYKYKLFIIIPIITFIFSVSALIYPYKLYKLFSVRQQPVRTRGLVTGIIIACLLQSIIAIIINVSTYTYAYKTLHLVNDRINGFNNFIHNKIYKNADFLAQMKDIPSNSLLVMKVVQNALRNIDKNPSVDNLANAFFTLNLYFHYHKIGYRNVNITNAMKIFDIHNLFIGSSIKDKINIINRVALREWSPADFLFRNSTFIEDYSVQMKRLYLSIPGNTTSVRSIDLATNKVSSWLEELNNRANMLSPEDSWSRFLPMAITILIVQCVPILIFIYLFRKERRREAFIGVLKKLYPNFAN